MSLPRQIDPSIRMLGAPADGLDDLRQHVHGAAAMIELPAAMVGNVDPFHAVIDCDPSILGGGDSLDCQWNLEPLLDALDCAPVEPGLERAVLHAAPAGGHEALGEIALAPAVMGGVNGQTERRIAMRDRALDVVVDPSLVAAHIELIETQRVRSGGRRGPRGRDRTLS